MRERTQSQRAKEDAQSILSKPICPIIALTIPLFEAVARCIFAIIGKCEVLLTQIFQKSHS
jgi:hypothetical protein